MLSKDQQKELRTIFWGTLSKRMEATKSALGKKVNWLNYPIRLKEAYVRMEFDDDGARFCIDLQHRDLGVRELFYEQFQEFKPMLETALGEPVKWKTKHLLADSNFESSRIFTEKSAPKFSDKNTWPEAWEFLQVQLIGFDRFWAETRDVFLGFEK